MNKIKKILIGIVWFLAVILAYFFIVVPTKESFYRPVEFARTEKIEILSPVLIKQEGKEIKLAGVIPPPKETLLYKRATAELRELVGNKKIKIKRVNTKFDSDYAFVWADELFVNAELARQGFVKADFNFADGREFQEILKAVKEAQANQRGMWGEVEVK